VTSRAYKRSWKNLLINKQYQLRFTLFMVGIDGSGLEQVSYGDTFDAFPVFSPDGRYLVFSSNRNNGGTRETNLFLAEWKD